MRSYFSRIFIPGILLLLAALTMVGAFFQVLVREYLTETTLDEMKANSRTISRLASAYYIEDMLSGHDFLVNLSLTANISGTDMVIFDTTGNLLLCSDSPMGCIHQGMQLSDTFVKQVLSTGMVAAAGRVEGLYATSRYVVAVPIETITNPAVGIVLLSAPISQTARVLARLTSSYIYVSVVVILLALVIMLYLARKQSSPLKGMAATATAFGHGDMQARMDVGINDPREVQDMAVAFNNMAASLEKSEFHRREFVANVSHELKTPLTTIGGYVDGILDGTIPPERQSHYMRIVSDETRRLNRLVRSMLDISRLQEQQGFPEDEKNRFDVGECASRVLLTFEQKITGRNLDVDVLLPEHPLFTEANEDAIIQVLYNLLDNAVKFCPEGGNLRLSVQERDNKILVSVGNDGPTIPAEELPLVFERFHKLDKSRNREQDGWGLGLYIVKTLVCSHGEDISVASGDGYTAFTFTLPLIL